MKRLIIMFKLNSNYITKKEALENLLSSVESEIRNWTAADIDILDYLDENADLEENIISIGEIAEDIIYYEDAREALKYVDWDEVAEKIKNCGVSLFDAIRWQTREDTEAILWKYEDRIRAALDLLACPCSVITDEEDEDTAERISIITEAHESFLLDRPILEDLCSFMDCLDEEEQLEIIKIIIRDLEKIAEEAEKIEDCSGAMGFAGSFKLALEEYCSGYSFIVTPIYENEE